MKHARNCSYCDRDIARSAGSDRSTSGSRARTSSASTSGSSLQRQLDKVRRRQLAKLRELLLANRRLAIGQQAEEHGPGAVRLVGRLPHERRQRIDQRAA